VGSTDRFETRRGRRGLFRAEKDHTELATETTIGRLCRDVSRRATIIGHDRSVSNDKAVSVGNNRKVAIG
jgi:hypothetical protein